MSKHNVGLKTLLQGSLSEPEFYGDLVSKFRKHLAEQFKTINCQSKQTLSLNMDTLRQTAYMVVNTIKVDNLLFSHCSTVGRSRT